MSGYTTIKDITNNLKGMRSDCDKLTTKLNAYNGKENINDVKTQCENVNSECEKALLYCMMFTRLENIINNHIERIEQLNNPSFNDLLDKKLDTKLLASALKINNSELTKDLTDKINSEIEMVSLAIEMRLKYITESTKLYDAVETLCQENLNTSIQNLKQQKESYLNEMKTMIEPIVKLHSSLTEKAKCIKNPSIRDAIKEYLTSALEWLSKIFKALKEFFVGKPQSTSTPSFENYKHNSNNNSEPSIYSNNNSESSIYSNYPC